MLKKLLKILFRLLLWSFMIILFLVFLLVALPRLITFLSTRSRVYTVESAPVHRAAIVFGAGLWRDGSPTPVLRDRVATAAQLYFAGKVEKLLMSGDNSYVEHNEPGAMRGYALELGVPDEAIVLDYAGRRTYDTCYRAKAIFGLQEAVLVTQSVPPAARPVCLQRPGIALRRRARRPAQLPEPLAALLEPARSSRHAGRPVGSASHSPATDPGETRTHFSTGGSMNRPEALAIVREYVKNENLVRHMLAVEAAMRFYAEKFGEDVETWGLTGLLHDFDWEIHPSLEGHPQDGAPILQNAASHL